VYSGVFDARNTQVELVKQKYTKRVFDVAFDVFAQIVSALWGVHHSYRVGPAGYRRSRSGAEYICKMLATVRIMRAFNSRTKRGNDAPFLMLRLIRFDPAL
jgi:hypothetical protein